jgi:hypothetical protein
MVEDRDALADLLDRLAGEHGGEGGEAGEAGNAGPGHAMPPWPGSDEEDS